VTLAPIAVGVPQAAVLLDISESQVRELVHAGLLARVPHLGRRLVISVDELHRFANDKTAATA